MSFLVSSALNFPFASLLNYLLSYLYFPHQFVKVHYLFWSQLFVSYIHCKHPSLFCDSVQLLCFGASQVALVVKNPLANAGNAG